MKTTALVSNGSFSYDDRLIYKILMRSCVFDDIKHDKKALFCVTILDFCEFARFRAMQR